MTSDPSYQPLPDQHLVDAIATPEVIHQIYHAFLDRPADTGGMTALLDRKATVGQVEAEIRNSAEFARRGRLLVDANKARYDGAMLLMAPARVMFCPIAKVANTSVKDWALRLVGDGQEPPSACHEWLDGGKNRMQARFYSFTLRQRLFATEGWVTAALIRDPFERIVSAYCDKFGRNRAQAGVLHHTTPVYTFLNGGQRPDDDFVARGISFRQFCHYLNHTPVEEHDSHWAPQAAYLRNLRWDRLFAMDRIEAFEDFVRDRLPPALRDHRLGMTNVNDRSQEPVTTDLSDALPDQWRAKTAPPYQAFLTDDIRRFVANHFSMDVVLYEKCTGDAAV